MTERIRKIIETERLNSALFAEKIGVSPGAISNVLRGRNKAGNKVLKNILDAFPELNAEWLISGKNPMYSHEKIFLHPHSKEPGLFDDENQSLNHQKKEINVSTELKVSEYPLKNIDKIPVLTPQPITSKEINSQISSNKKIDKIMIFYSDNTFESFSPDK